MWRILWLPAIIAICGCASSQSAIPSRFFAPLKCPNESLTIPVVGDSSDSAYLSYMMGVAVKDVFVDGRAARRDEFDLEDLDIRVVQLGGRTMLYVMHLAWHKVDEQGAAEYALLSVTAYGPHSYKAEAFVIPRGAKEIEIVYAVRSPDGRLGPQKEIWLSCRL
jgi:hypothetical protein